MSIKEKRERVYWEWMQSIGKTSYVWRQIFASSLGFVAILYPCQAGIGLAFGWAHSSAPYPSVGGVVGFLLSGALGGLLAGSWTWRHYERRYRAGSSLTVVT